MKFLDEKFEIEPMISSQRFTKNIRLSGPVINDFIPYLSCEKLSFNFA